MKKFTNTIEIRNSVLKVVNALLVICLCILAAATILFFLLSVPFYKKEIERAQLPTEIVEVPPGIRVAHLKIGGWLLWQQFVIVNPPGIFGDSKEWIRKYDREHPLDPEIVKKLLEKEKNAKTNLNTDKYTDEQKKDNRVAYERTFYRESTLTPRDWDGKQHDDLFKYKEHIILYRSGFVEGFDKVEWIIEESIKE